MADRLIAGYIACGTDHLDIDGVEYRRYVAMREADVDPLGAMVPMVRFVVDDGEALIAEVKRLRRNADES